MWHKNNIIALKNIISFLDQAISFSVDMGLRIRIAWRILLFCKRTSDSIALDLILICLSVAIVCQEFTLR